MSKWRCGSCDYVYDEAHGDPEEGIPPGTEWDALPEDCLIALTWRMVFLDAEVNWLEIDSGARANPLRMLADDNTLYPAPHPSHLFGADATRNESEAANVQ